MFVNNVNSILIKIQTLCISQSVLSDRHVIRSVCIERVCNILQRIVEASFVYRIVLVCEFENFERIPTDKTTMIILFYKK